MALRDTARIDQVPLGARRLQARRLVSVLVGVIVVALVIDTWFISGLFVPVIVASGSMAPALLGPHRHWQCASCGLGFECGIESLPSAGQSAICPFCDVPAAVESGSDRPGSRVLVDRFTLLWRPPRRWEVIVVHPPDDPRELAVKRVVGLPGEFVSIEGGDLWINGRIARKSLDEQRSMVVPVHEMSPRGDRAWRANPEQSWRLTGGRWVHPAKDIAATGDQRRASKVIDWLEFQPNCDSTMNSTQSETFIFDDSSYDQIESRVLHPVFDLLLSFEVQAVGQGLLYLRARDHGEEFRIRLNVDTGKGTLLHNGTPAAEFAIARSRPTTPARVDCMLADHRLLLAIDTRVILDHAYELENGEASAGEQGLAIGTESAEVELRKLKIGRDVYYLSPAGDDARVDYQLGADEYLLLGDNSPHSVDSRIWSVQGGITSRQIVGRVVAW